MKFDITYEIMTPESAENGCLEDSGHVLQDLTLSEAYACLKYEPVEHVERRPDGSGSIYFQSYHPDPRSCAEKTLVLHWGKCSKYSQKRIVGVFND